MNPAPEPIIVTQPAEPSTRETASITLSMVIGSTSSPPAARGTRRRKMCASAMAAITELGKRRAASASSTVARISGSSASAASSGSVTAAGVLARLDERGEFRERRLPAGLVVGKRDAGRQAIVDGVHIGATVRIDQLDCDRHLAAQRGIGRLELNHLDQLLVRHELHEAAVVGVGLRGRLAG